MSWDIWQSSAIVLFSLRLISSAILKLVCSVVHLWDSFVSHCVASMLPISRLFAASWGTFSMHTCCRHQD